MNVKDYFDILGVSPTKDEKIIKRAYRKKALQYHPDKNHSPGAKIKFIEVTEAYDHLLTAIDKAKKQDNPIEEVNHQTKSEFHPRTPQRSMVQREQEERFKMAYMRYQYMKRKEAEEYERYYQSITSGKRWSWFRILVFACTLTSLLLTLDALFLHTSFKSSYITKSNSEVVYSSITGGSTTPIVLEDGEKVWVPINVVNDGETEDLYIEYTSLFKEIKSIRLWENNRWESYTPDYSIIKTFPAIPLILLLPFFTFISKSKSYTFIVFNNISLYFISIVLFVVLYSNDRLFHLITFLLD